MIKKKKYTSDLKAWDYKQTKENEMSKINIETATIEELEQECIRVWGTPYGHNMIGIICGVAAERFGEEEGDRLFEEYQQ
jgi:hypothetical protein